MSSFKAKLIFSILSYGLIVGGALGCVLFYLFPAYYPNCYFGILIFFLVLEPLLVLFVEGSSSKSTPKQLLNVYMLAKVFKTILSLIFVTIYALAIAINTKSFVLSFMILYMLFLAIETILFTRIEKRLKENKQ